MILSVTSVNGLPKGKLKKRAIDYFYLPSNKPKKLPYSLLIKEMGMHILFLDKGIVFDSYEKLPGQKSFVKDCVEKLFKNDILAYHCSDDCDWFSNVDKHKFYKV